MSSSLPSPRAKPLFGRNPEDELEELKAFLKERKMREKAPKVPKKGSKKLSLGRSAAAAAAEEERRRAASEAVSLNASSSPTEGVEVRAPSPDAFEYALST